MNNVEQYIVRAFTHRLIAKRANTRTDGSTLFVHETPIAYYDADGGLYMRVGDRNTGLVRSRLNAIAICDGRLRCVGLMREDAVAVGNRHRIIPLGDEWTKVT